MRAGGVKVVCVKTIFIDSIVILDLTVKQIEHLNLTYEKLTKTNPDIPNEQITPGQKVMLKVSGVSDAAYIWIDKNNNKILGTSTTPEYLVRPYNSRWYEVRVDDMCIISDTVFVPVIFPTAITPHFADDFNDYFLPELGCRMIIFNRYGQKVYEGYDGWNGEYRGKTADPGAYFYVVNLPDGEVKRGTIEVVKIK